MYDILRLWSNSMKVYQVYILLKEIKKVSIVAISENWSWEGEETYE